MAVNFLSTSRSRLRLAIALFAVLALFVTACGGADSFSSVTDAAGDAADAASDSATQESGEEAMEDSDEGAFETQATIPSSNSQADLSVADERADDASPDSDGEAATNSGQTPPTRTAAQRGREIIYTATVSIGVDDVEAAGAEAAAIIEEIGGFVADQNTTGGAEPRSQITFKVDPENFSVVLQRLSGIGELRNQIVSTDDVTERVVDLNSRIEVTQLGVDRLREAMENATNLEDFARLEELLLSRESDLEVMRGTLRTLRDQIDLATITLILEQDRVDNQIAVAVTSYEGHDAGVGCPGNDGDRFEPGDEVTLCFEAINAGDQTLTNLNITDTVLGIDGIGELTTIFGDPAEIQPGQSVVLAYELDAQRDQQLRMAVTATPTDGTTAEAAGPTVRAQLTPRVRVDESAADPGFSDGFGAGASLLSSIWVSTKVIVGFILPLLILLPFFALAIYILRRMTQARRERKAAMWQANQPPPPQSSTGSNAAAAMAGAAAMAPEETSSDESE